ncbi:MAG: DUF4381 domain-containing protein [Gammaproteobacteria bacterium]
MNPKTLPLRDIIIPEAIDWWPPALGWWLLAVIIPVLVGLGVILYKRITRTTALKSAKKILTDIKHDTEHDDFDKLCRLSVLIRRVAISLAPRSESASLTGLAWLEYLDGPMQGRPFSQGAGRQLIDAPYRDKETLQVDLPELISLCENWLKAQAKRKK